jgi:2,4-dienoyl-CoA reductase-like NADH-dependent reductase (Old Yellow Enzyme family)
MGLVMPEFQVYLVASRGLEKTTKAVHENGGKIIIQLMHSEE